MKKPDIAKQMARRTRVSAAEAADRLDQAVWKILADLKRGEDTTLPGLGRIRASRNGRMVFERD